MSSLDPFLLEVIACPACHGVLDVGADRIDCAACRLRFPLVDGIPVLLLSDATAWDPEANA